MKKLSDYLKAYETFSGKASDLNRQLAFAGIALIWVFKEGEKSPCVPADLLLPSALLAVALALDLLHYFTGTIIWGRFYRYHEVRRKTAVDDPELEASIWYTLPLRLLWLSKIVAVVTGLGLIVWYIANRWIAL